ncbi:hypothetical protein H3H36_01960 [Duganella sp. FT3S]|uniref:Uncharacterized protein n=1 Tax=Rugamonas fusca TaxID=2758568 RepID=A0A7W2EDV8_9BURK|nr:hypothetical protein [Rugamonas fusca]MBA5604126.1 hypothetical protein [Rugamonas fusca]
MNRHKVPQHAHSASVVPAGAVTSSVQVPPATAGAQPAKFDPLEDAKHYVEMNTPRVAGLPQTAPKYDELTKPVRVPVPAACLQFRNDCKCYTQQGTPMDVRYNMCIEFARNGFFQDFDPEKDRVASERTAASVRVMEGRGGQLAAAGEVGAHGAGQVSAFGNPPPEAPHKPSVGM